MRLRKAVTILQTILSLALGAIFVAGAIGFYQYANANLRDEKLVANIQALASNIRVHHTVIGNFANVSSDVAIAAELAPPEMIRTRLVGAPFNFVTPFGQPIRLATGVAGIRDSFSVLVSAESPRTCALLVQNAFNGTFGNFYSITVNSTVLFIPGTNNVTSDATLAACSQATNVITLVLR